MVENAIDFDADAGSAKNKLFLTVRHYTGNVIFLKEKKGIGELAG